MGLSDIVLPTETIEVSNSSFSVRGLSLNEITRLVLGHRDVVENVFARISGRDPDSIGISDATQLGQDLLERSPEFVAEVISLAAEGDFEENLKVATRLPIGTQIIALEKIGKLTFESEQTLKKVIESLIASMQGVKKAVKSL